MRSILNATSKNPVKTVAVVKWLMENVKKVVFADGTATSALRVFVEGFFPGKAMYIRNSWRPSNKTCSFVPTPIYGKRRKALLKTLNNTELEHHVRYARQDEYGIGSEFFDIVKQEVRNKTPLYVAVNSVALGHEIVKNTFGEESMAFRGLRDHMVRSHPKGAMTHNPKMRFPLDLCTLIAQHVGERDIVKYDYIYDGSPHESRDFDNRTINSAQGWQQNAVLIVSPRIREGIDHQVPHFHNSLVYCGPKSCETFSVMTQMLGRNRQYATDTPHAYISVNKKLCGATRFHCCDLDELRTRTSQLTHFATALSTVCSGEWAAEHGDLLDPLFRELTVRLILERECFLEYPMESAQYWLELAGWREVETAPARPTVRLKQWELGLLQKALDEIGDISEDEYEDRACSRRKLTTSDKYEMARYKFLHMLFQFTPETDPETVASLWKLYQATPGQVYNMLSARDDEELGITIMNAWSGEFRTGTSTSTFIRNPRPLQLQEIRKIETALGKQLLECEGETKFTEAALTPALAVVEENIDRLSLIFQGSWKSPFHALKAVLDKWGSYKILRGKKGKEKMLKFPSQQVKEDDWKEFLRQHPEFGLNPDEDWPKKRRRKTVKQLKAEHKTQAKERRDTRDFILRSPRWDFLRPESYIDEDGDQVYNYFG